MRRLLILLVVCAATAPNMSRAASDGQPITASGKASVAPQADQFVSVWCDIGTSFPAVFIAGRMPLPDGSSQSFYLSYNRDAYTYAGIGPVRETVLADPPGSLNRTVGFSYQAPFEGANFVLGWAVSPTPANCWLTIGAGSFDDPVVPSQQLAAGSAYYSDTETGATAAAQTRFGGTVVGWDTTWQAHGEMFAQIVSDAGAIAVTDPSGLAYAGAGIGTTPGVCTTQPEPCGYGNSYFIDTVTDGRWSVSVLAAASTPHVFAPSTHVYPSGYAASVWAISL